MPLESISLSAPRIELFDEEIAFVRQGDVNATVTFDTVLSIELPYWTFAVESELSHIRLMVPIKLVPLASLSSGFESQNKICLK